MEPQIVSLLVTSLAMIYIFMSSGNNFWHRNRLFAQIMSVMAMFWFVSRLWMWLQLQILSIRHSTRKQRALGRKCRPIFMSYHLYNPWWLYSGIALSLWINVNDLLWLCNTCLCNVELTLSRRHNYFSQACWLHFYQRLSWWYIFLIFWSGWMNVANTTCMFGGVWYIGHCPLQFFDIFFQSTARILPVRMVSWSPNLLPGLWYTPGTQH